jgi:tRNA-specific 2-thiouridylase
LDRNANRVVVGGDDELWSASCEVHGVNWVSTGVPDGPIRAMVKIRHRHEPAAATVEPTGHASARVKFDAPQRAITPGQAAVFYCGEMVAGGGWIGQDAAC